MANQTELLRDILAELKQQRAVNDAQDRQERRSDRNKSAKGKSKSKPGMFKNAVKKMGVGKGASKLGGDIKEGISDTFWSTAIIAAAVPFVDGFFNAATKTFGDNATIGERIASGIGTFVEKIASIFGIEVDGSNIAKSIMDFKDDAVKAFEKLKVLFGQVSTFVTKTSKVLSDLGFNPTDKPPAPNGSTEPVIGGSEELAGVAAGLKETSKRLGKPEVVANPKATPKMPKAPFKVGDVYKTDSGALRKVTGISKSGAPLSATAPKGANVTVSASKMAKYDKLRKGAIALADSAMPTVAKTGGFASKAFGFLGKMVSKAAIPLQMASSATEGYEHYKETGDVGAGLASGGSSFVGAMGGGLAGAKGGAALGAFLGPVGIAVGGLIGGIGGSILGEIASRNAGEAIYDMATGADKVPGSASNTNTAIENNANTSSTAGSNNNTQVAVDNSNTTVNNTVTSAPLKTRSGFTNSMEDYMLVM